MVSAATICPDGGLAAGGGAGSQGEVGRLRLHRRVAVPRSERHRHRDEDGDGEGQGTHPPQQRIDVLGGGPDPLGRGRERDLLRGVDVVVVVVTNALRGGGGGGPAGAATGVEPCEPALGDVGPEPELVVIVLEHVSPLPNPPESEPPPEGPSEHERSTRVVMKTQQCVNCVTDGGSSRERQQPEPGGVRAERISRGDQTRRGWDLNPRTTLKVVPALAVRSLRPDSGTSPGGRKTIAPGAQVTL